MIFPDTVFFEKGKAKLIVKTDKEFCLQGVRNIAKLNNQNVYKDFSNIVRERKKDGLGIFYMRYGPDFAGKYKSDSNINHGYAGITKSSEHKGGMDNLDSTLKMGAGLQVPPIMSNEKLLSMKDLGSFTTKSQVSKG